MICNNKSKYSVLIIFLITVKGWIPQLRRSGKVSYSLPPIVILPGFGNDMQDYINPSNKNDGLKDILSSRGVSSFVVPIIRTDWLNVARGIFTIDFWKSSCKPKALFYFYFDAVDKMVKEVVQDNGNQPVILVGHSAGGWLARAILADGQWAAERDENKILSSDLVCGLVTLGAPHFPPGIAGAMDITRGALKFTNNNYPGAFLKDQIFYITVAGTAVLSNATAPRGSTENFASQSYRMVSGDKSREMIGDGVVPLEYAHLDSAVQVTIPNAFHSINAPGNKWYGGNDFVDIWLRRVEELVKKQKSKKLKR